MNTVVNERTWIRESNSRLDNKQTRWKQSSLGNQGKEKIGFSFNLYTEDILGIFDGKADTSHD